MDKITRLSDAIMLGAMRRPQCHGYFFEHGGSCALGAAIDSTGVKEDYDELTRRFPELKRTMVSPIPLLSFRRQNLWEIIVELNDLHDWTRESIASWLESIGL